MKKTNKKGFTLVEIMIVVAIIGLLAAIGIPSIMNAYQTAQTNSKERNITEVEKAKGILTLPAGTIAGAQGLSTNDAFNVTNVLDVLQIDGVDKLTVGGSTITIGDWTTRATY